MWRGPQKHRFLGYNQTLYIDKKQVRRRAHNKNEINLITEPAEVADYMNNYYTGIADNIGTVAMLPEPHNFSSTADFVKHSCEYHAEHPSILNINNKCTKMPDYSLSEARSSEIRKIIKNLNPRKTTGHDMLPAKALIPIRDIIDIPLCHTYNACIKTSSFPSQSKKSRGCTHLQERWPTYTKNHRPISILPTSSKIFEKLLESRLQPFLQQVYHPNLSAFRPGFSCQHVLIHLCERWRECLENHQTVGMLLIDLSKAFDCLPYSLTVAKLRAYGLSFEATTLLADYLSNRVQRVKIGSA